jgi:hypothetical protein
MTTQKFWEFTDYGNDCKTYLIEATSKHDANNRAVANGADFTDKPCGCCGADWLKAITDEPEYTTIQDALDDYFGEDASIEEIEDSEDAEYLVILKNDYRYFKETVV